MNGNLILRGCLSINDFTSSAMQSLSQQCLLIFMIARPLSLYTTNQEKHRNEARLCSYIIEMAKLLSYCGVLLQLEISIIDS